MVVVGLDFPNPTVAKVADEGAGVEGRTVTDALAHGPSGRAARDPVDGIAAESGPQPTGTTGATTTSTRWADVSPPM